MPRPKHPSDAEIIPVFSQEPHLTAEEIKKIICDAVTTAIPKPDNSLRYTIWGLTVAIVASLATFVAFVSNEKFTYGKLTERVDVNTGLILHQQEEIDQLHLEIKQLAELAVQEKQQISDLERYHHLSGER